jgi:small subunit ribosomal protein S6e
MANFKVVISDPKSRKAYQKEIEQAQTGLLGKKLGDKVSGNHLGLAGFELEITGGSDKEGFPMRKDVDGPGRKRILLSHPPGFHPKSKGRRKRKSVRGNTISVSISQINLKVLTHGSKSIEDSLGVKKETTEEKSAKPPTSGEKSAPKEEKKEHAEKPAEKKAEHHESKKAEHPPSGQSQPKEEKHAEKPKEEHQHKEHKTHAEKPSAE